MKKIYSVAIGVAVFVLVFATTTSRLWALNGAQLTGFTAVNESLGGTGVAAPQDTSTLLVNPAGLTELPQLVNFNILVAWPTSQMNSIANPAAGTVTSNDDPVLLPGGAFTLPTPYLDERLFVGIGILPVAGFSLDYPTSRALFAATANAFDTHTFFGLMKIVPAAAYKINDQWSIGLSVHVDHARFATNSITAGGTQTTGRNRIDSSFGFGAEVGLLYKPSDFLSAGVSYTTEQWMKDFSRYKDVLLNGNNFPQQANAGLSIRPLSQLLINTDFRWIQWSGANGAFGDSVAAGGLGWQDQYIGMLGVQYQVFDYVTLRGGYNYGRSAIPAASLFASQLASPITEHHIGGGVGFKLGEKLDIDFSYLRSLSNTVTDSNAAAAGGGSFTTQSVHQMNAQAGLKF